MTRLKQAMTALGLLVVMLAGCATGQPRGWVDVSAQGTNYTEDYIYNVSIRIADGQHTGIGIARVGEFSRGGTGGNECCALIPGVGQTIKVIWHVGGRQEDESQWRTYSRDVVVIGAMPVRTTRHSYLLVRFFPGHEVEAELVPSADFDPKNPRVDKLYSGQRVMRQKGE